MSKSLHLLLTLVCTAALLAGARLGLTRYSPASEKVQSPRVGGPPSPAIEGLSIPLYASDGQPYSLLRVGSCRLHEKMGGLFGWTSITVAEMSNVQIDVQRPAASTGSVTVASGTDSAQVVAFLQDVPRHLGWPTVKDVDVRDITIRIQDRGDSISTIQATRLSPLGRGRFSLEHGVVLTANRGQRQLTTDQVVWWPDLEIYAVNGSYSLTGAAGIHKGRHTLFHTNLEPITNDKEIADYERRATLTTSLATSN
jgi:hypothetical protein